MTYINKLDSFDEVAAWYEKTPVLKSKQHAKEQDIRPIGKRSRKWERIIRVDPNTYALSCGGSYDPVFCWGWSTKKGEFPLTPKETAQLAPIVWRKHKDGTETVTVRNGQGPWHHNHVYSFLARALPRELWFRINRQGRHAIYNRSEGKEYYLPKTRTVPRHVYEHYKEQVSGTSGEWLKKRLRDSQLAFDNMSLTFKRTKEGKFELVGEAPREFVKKTRVDLMGKKKFKPHVNAVYDWAVTMHPLLRSQLNWGFRNEAGKRLQDIAKEHGIKFYGSNWGDLFSGADPNLIRKILIDPQHPMRYEFGLAAIFAIHDAAVRIGDNRMWNYSELTDEAFEKLQRSKMRAAYTKWINNKAGFAKVIKEEK